MKACNQCGKCCVKYAKGRLSVTDEEVKVWELFNPNIAHHVQNRKIWFDPDTGKQLDYCPWLRKDPKSNLHTCDIYFDRPDDCKYYPVTIQQMINDECEMIDEGDLDDPQKAQKQLDALMSDSRPAFED